MVLCVSGHVCSCNYGCRCVLRLLVCFFTHASVPLRVYVCPLFTAASLSIIYLLLCLVCAYTPYFVGHSFHVQYMHVLA